MNLEQQVVSLEYAKRLKELGVEQESYFYWVNKHQSGWTILYSHGSHCYEECSAFTVAELGELLPSGYWESHSVNAGYEIGYSRGGVKFGPDLVDRYFVLDRRESDARAKMLVYLIENNLYDPQTQKTPTNSDRVKT